MRFAWLTSFLGLLFLLLAGPASAEETTEALFARGVAALEKGDYPAAIDYFEALADRGLIHPDASYDRALAYIERIRDGRERPGDLGRAAAALEETLLAAPSDEDAQRALELVRAEVTKRRSRQAGASTVEARPTLDRALIGLASERVWAVLAAFGSTLLTLGLAFRRAQRDSPAHLAGTIAVPIGAVALLAFGTLAFGARHLRTTTEPAVVVVPSARLLDEKGLPLGGGASIPEAAKVEIRERRGSLVSVKWGAQEGWASARELRTIPSSDR